MGCQRKRESIMIRASAQDGTYPRPQLMRSEWRSLDGVWEFAHDDRDDGLSAGWWSGEVPLARRILVPFAPESSASGIGDTGYHPLVWYRRELTIATPSDGRRVLLHFGAVDHSCRVWVDGAEVGSHVGGQSPFSFDLTDHLASGSDRHVIVVRAYDDPHDLELPRGKQDWEPEPHAIWYTRTTGIWQTVWLEEVAQVRFDVLDWSTDQVAGTVTAEVRLNRPEPGWIVSVDLDLDGEALAAATATTSGGGATVVLRPKGLGASPDDERLLWTPERPVLLDAAVRLTDPAGAVRDEVASYVGIRTATVGRESFELNGSPYYVRSVLEQGFWPASLLTAPSDEERRREVELIKQLGFNAARIHQKAEDPRFLYWADRLGLLIWGEIAAGYAFSGRAAELITADWRALIARDRSHPCIVTWVPVNESWGVPDVASSEPQRDLVRALAALTRALDSSRPVVSNDGWEHVDSDILTIHDYTTDPGVLAARYADADAVKAAVDGPGPQAKALVVDQAMAERVRTGAMPVMLTEFGGISFAGDGSTWGYGTVDSAAEYGRLVGALFAAVEHSTVLAGFCFTQLTDTMQEANGLLTADREPKLPIEAIRAMVTGAAVTAESAASPT